MKILFQIFLFFCSFSIFAQDGNKMVKVNYYFEKNSLKANDSIQVIAELTPEKDWHIYWKNPGDFGLPTSIDCKLPNGFAMGEIEWEYPEIQASDGLINFGYSQTFYLVFKIYAPSNIDANALDFNIKTSWLVCKDRCIPGSKTDTFNSNNLVTNPKWSELINNIYNKIPKKALNKYFVAVKDSEKVTLKFDKVNLPTSLRVFPIDLGIYNYKEKYELQRGDGFTFITLDLDKMRIGEPEKLNIVLVPMDGFPLKEDRTAIEINVDFSK